MKALPYLVTNFTNKSFHLEEKKEKHFYDFLHQHREIQITLILEGEGQLIAGDYNDDFKSGDIFVLGSYIPHVFQNDQKYFSSDFQGRVHSLSIFFNWESFGQNFWYLPELHKISLLEKIFKRGLKIEEPYLPTLKECMHEIFNAEGFGKIIILLRILNIMASMEHFNPLSKVIDFRIDSTDGARLKKVFDFTMQNYHKQISLEDVADLVHLSLNSFCRFFKRRTEKTYFEFLSEIRVDKACRLLLQDQSECIYKICFEVGFNDIANFNRQFKKVTGFTPTSYKSLTRQADGLGFVAAAS